MRSREEVPSSSPFVCISSHGGVAKGRHYRHPLPFIVGSSGVGKGGRRPLELDGRDAAAASSSDYRLRELEFLFSMRACPSG
ncbi:hypothetical protein GQ55_9G347300 [Panicum hallii var. hallii]|uniref:Uncharacterized protein n=1 Tax=Panicum hallii var. hallii TaxID=1504633 RepID=A0A2T7C8J3_9POAL|nr:hypothetical protein GQ55_9G347300 [Panicum hallii var. hallii]